MGKLRYEMRNNHYEDGQRISLADLEIKKVAKSKLDENIAQIDSQIEKALNKNYLDAGYYEVLNLNKPKYKIENKTV